MWFALREADSSDSPSYQAFQKGETIQVCYWPGLKKNTQEYTLLNAVMLTTCIAIIFKQMIAIVPFKPAAVVA